MNKKDVQSYTRKLYKFLKGKPVIQFVKMIETRGLIEYSNDCVTCPSDSCISLDHRDQVIPTLIHEFLHYNHKEWTETQVLQMEKKLINNLSHCQIKNILKKLADIL